MKQYFIKNWFFIIVFGVGILFSKILYADNNASVSSPITNINQSSNASEAFPADLLYPKYFKSHDLLLWENIKQDLLFKLRFLFGRRFAQPYTFCHKFQRRMIRAVDRAINEGKVDITKVDNKLLFEENPDINKIISPQPKLLNSSCVYHSLGDIRKGCVLYCEYHGMDFESDFYIDHKKELEAAKPFITSEDIAELIIFLPSVILMIIVLLFLPDKKKFFSWLFRGFKKHNSC